MPKRLIGPLGVALAAVVAFVAALALAGGSSGDDKPDAAKANSGPTARPVAFAVHATAPPISTGLRAATIPHLKPKPKPKPTSDGGGDNHPTTNPGTGGTITDPGNTTTNPYNPGNGGGGNPPTNNNNGNGNGPTHTTPPDPGE
jgi:hypothetical protein